MIECVLTPEILTNRLININISKNNLVGGIQILLTQGPGRKKCKTYERICVARPSIKKLLFRKKYTNYQVFGTTVKEERKSAAADHR